MKMARSYVIFTFMLVNHFVLNPPQSRDVYLDLGIESRSKINTDDDCVKLIWPIIYVVND